MKFLEFFGWYPFALTHGLNPLTNTYVNLPTGSNMMWDTTFPFVAIVLAPVTLFFNVMASFNVAMVGALTLDGWCTFLWLRRHVKNSIAAWLGGLVVAFGPFAATRAHGHLVLLFFFPIPLIFIEIERIVESKGRISLWSGTWLGALAALQLLCFEEILALTAVVVATTMAIGALVYPSYAKELVAAVARILGVALGVFLVLTAVPLGYQFLGPGRIHGPIQVPGEYVTDVVNYVIPGAFAAIVPRFASTLSTHWAGGVFENDAYVGIPLLVIASFVLVRFWRDTWVRLIGIGTIVAMLWSLGPHLHFDGVQHLAIPLPGRLLSHLPVFNNILPARFDLLMDFGLAAILAVFLDRMVISESGKWRVLPLAAAVLVAVTLAPDIPVVSTGPETPKYFLPGGDVKALRQGTIALVVPYGDGELTFAPMLWQAMSHFRVRMVAGAMYTAGRNGTPSLGRSLWGTGSTLDCLMQLLQAGTSIVPCTSHPVAVARSELDQLRVSIIIMGPLAYGTDPALTGPMQKFLSAVAGVPPRRDEGVLIWTFRR